MPIDSFAISTILTVVTILLWATARLPEYYVALLFFVVAMIFAVAPPDVIFSGFSSSAFWLIFSGFIIGGAIRNSGLADRAAYHILPHISSSWIKMIAGVILMAYGLAFIMPSNVGRITLLMPIVLAMSDRVGLGYGTSGRTGLALALGLGTFQLSASILPANVPNLILSGAIENLYNIHLSYLPYIVLHAPILGIAKGIVLIACIYWLFPAKLQIIEEREAAPPAMSAKEYRLLAVMGISVAFWMTDALHGISPAWIGLAAACFCLMPRFGFITHDEFPSVVNIRSCIYVAGILGLAQLVTDSGLGELLGKELISYLPDLQGRAFLAFLCIIFITTCLNFVVTANGVPALVTPLAQTLANESALPLMTVLMMQVISYSTPILPYQAAPIIVAMSLGKIAPKDGTKLCLLVAAITFLLLVPLDFLWFSLLGKLA